MRNFMLIVILFLSPEIVHPVGVTATVDTNGVLQGYVVQKDGVTICENPSVWNDFRAGGGYIVCN